LLAILALGFVLGMRHATDPDHVIAISTIVTRQPSMRGAALVGAVWGLGHTLTILVVGGGIVLMGWVIPPRLGLSMELSVGVMLIVLGIMNLTSVMGRIAETPAGDPHSHGHVHSHPHQHGDYVHSHAHGHDPEVHPHRPDQTPVGWLDRHFARMGVYQLLRPLIVGIVHGLAGSAAVALLVLTTIGNPVWGVLYLGVFGVGTIAGMMLVTVAIAIPFAVSGPRFARLHHRLRIATGLLSLGFGLFLAYHVGIVNGLFTGHLQGTPH
jgi:high-affinity nickel-transport protein